MYELRNSAGVLVDTISSCNAQTSLGVADSYSVELAATDSSACAEHPSSCEVFDVVNITVLSGVVPDLEASIVSPANNGVNAIYGSRSMYEYSDFVAGYDISYYENAQCVWYKKNSYYGTPTAFLTDCNFSGLASNQNMQDLGFDAAGTYYISVAIEADQIASGLTQSDQTSYFSWTITEPGFNLFNPVQHYNFQQGGGSLYTRASPVNFPAIAGYPPTTVTFTYFVNTQGSGSCDGSSTQISGNGIYSGSVYSKTFTESELVSFKQVCAQQSNPYSCAYCLRVETSDGYAVSEFENRIINNMY